MKKNTLFSLLIVLSAVSVNAQNGGALPQNMRAAATLQKLGSMTPTDLLYGIPMPEKQLIGDAYLDPEWKSSTLMLYNSETMLEGYPVRYDLIKDELEIKSKSGVKVIAGNKVKSFVSIDSVTRRPHYFINAREFKNEEGVTVEGFYKVLADGRLPLLLQTEALIKRANYSVQFDVGSRDDQIIKKTKLFYARDGKVIPAPNSKKKVLALMTDKREQVEKFIKINQLMMSDQMHLTRLFEYYNSLN